MPKLTAKGDAAIWLGAIFFVLDLLSVILRILARRTKRIALAVDDYLIILAIPLEFTYISLLLWGVIGGGGALDITEITSHELYVLFKVQYIANFFINTICTLVKLSVIYLYRRIFDVSKQFHSASQVILYLCMAWYIVATCFAIIPCQPIKAAWVVGPEGPYPTDHCINFPVYFVCIEVTNVVLDIMILCLPVQMVRHLQLPYRQKLYLSGIFLLGGFVCIAGILRVAIVYKPGRNLSLILLTYFSILETSVAIICACLPTYRPLLASSSLLVDRLKQWYGSQKLTRPSLTAFSSRPPDSVSQFNEISDSASNNKHFSETIGLSDRNSADHSDRFPLRSISRDENVNMPYHGQ